MILVSGSSQEHIHHMAMHHNMGCATSKKFQMMIVVRLCTSVPFTGREVRNCVIQGFLLVCTV